MDFVSEINAYPVAKIAAALGAPERTIYAYKMGERLPPVWVQHLIVREIRRKRISPVRK